MARAATSLKLKERLEANDAQAPTATPEGTTPAPTLTELRPETLSYLPQPEGEGRKGKRATVGHFSQAMSRKLNALAALEGRTLQSIMGEAWDMWLESRQQPPFNER